ncbi:hypothetical protein PMIN07_009582 [Paraphaeosphaeria minitans]
MDAMDASQLFPPAQDDLAAFFDHVPISFPTTVTPEELHSTTSILLEDLATSSSSSHSHFYNDLDAHDSAVDLRGQWAPPIKQDSDMDSSDPYDQFLTMGDSPMATNNPSPATDTIFSQSNSPHAFLGDRSSVSSPGGAAPGFTDAILIPQSRDAPHVSLAPDKTKTRAETQIKMTLTLDPLDNVEYIRFPRKTLAKPKHFASDEEKQEIESKGAVLQMNVHLVCATAIEAPRDRQRALRRAAGTEPTPRRPEAFTSVTELDKEDPSHPQNGGEVLICQGCKERERKRYDRKKKRGEDEDEFTQYENDRVIMINEKEHKKLREVEDAEMQFTPRARQVDFAMRIACYCRHQEEKTPKGYCVIFTFTLDNALLVQHVSDVFHITDDHKNKELSVDARPQPLAIPQYGMHSYYQQQPNVVPMYQFTENYGLGAFSQPTTPTYSQTTTPMYSQPTTPMFSQPTTPMYSQPTTPMHSQPTTPMYSQPTTPMNRRPDTGHGLGWNGNMMGWDVSGRYDQVHGAQLNGAHSNGAQLNGAQLNGAHSNGAHSNGAHSNGAQLNGAQLNGAQMNGAQLNGAHMMFSNGNVFSTTGI